MNPNKHAQELNPGKMGMASEVSIVMDLSNIPAPVARVSGASALVQGCQKQATTRSVLEPRICAHGPAPQKPHGLKQQTWRSVHSLACYLYKDWTKVSALHAAHSENKSALGQSSSDTDKADEALGWQLCYDMKHTTAQVKLG